MNRNVIASLIVVLSLALTAGTAIAATVNQRLAALEKAVALLSVRIPVISAAQSGRMAAPRSGVSRPERSDAGRSVICHTRAAVSSLPGFFVVSPRSA
jgi:hypothetical protein